MPHYDVKQVIAVRKDLAMRKGKIAAQVAHASMKAILDRKIAVPDPKGYLMVIKTDELMNEWLYGSFAKIVVYVDSLEELMEMRNKAAAQGMHLGLIVDSGHTEFHGMPTITCCAFGPARKEDVDKITGHLRLI